ncbi:hypothetical protein BLNAU_5371 [Blattamonas nauphoetae]|uniref:Uncharacterized protein n=1 Tax=Blattamonas nauphoetae TaxID=2049346 RepID=A0ABQ9Y747_9EUKA|nr:hypothetical protein BLNAU_5371 [Blattamonas nauphoetae]
MTLPFLSSLSSCIASLRSRIPHSSHSEWSVSTLSLRTQLSRTENEDEKWRILVQIAVLSRLTLFETEELLALAKNETQIDIALLLLIKTRNEPPTDGQTLMNRTITKLGEMGRDCANFNRLGQVWEMLAVESEDGRVFGVGVGDLREDRERGVADSLICVIGELNRMWNEKNRTNRKDVEHVVELCVRVALILTEKTNRDIMVLAPQLAQFTLTTNCSLLFAILKLFILMEEKTKTTENPFCLSSFTFTPSPHTQHSTHTSTLLSSFSVSLLAISIQLEHQFIPSNQQFVAFQTQLDTIQRFGKVGRQIVEGVMSAVSELILHLRTKQSDHPTLTLTVPLLLSNNTPLSPEIVMNSLQPFLVPLNHSRPPQKDIVTFAASLSHLIALVTRSLPDIRLIGDPTDSFSRFVRFVEGIETSLFLLAAPLFASHPSIHSLLSSLSILHTSISFLVPSALRLVSTSFEEIKKLRTAFRSFIRNRPALSDSLWLARIIALNEQGLEDRVEQLVWNQDWTGLRMLGANILLYPPVRWGGHSTDDDIPRPPPLPAHLVPHFPPHVPRIHPLFRGIHQLPPRIDGG